MQDNKDSRALLDAESRASECRLERTYRRVYSHPALLAVFDAVSLFAVVFTVAAYFLTLILLLTMKRDFLLAIKLGGITAAPFLALSAFRRVFNAPRPYELYDFSRFTDSLPKDKKGRSVPSRHVFSSFVIGSSVCFIYLHLGIAVLILGTALAVLRVLRGIHFPRDVVAGGLIGAICGVVGMLIATAF